MCAIYDRHRHRRILARGKARGGQHHYRDDEQHRITEWAHCAASSRNLRFTTLDPATGSSSPFDRRQCRELKTWSGSPVATCTDPESTTLEPVTSMPRQAIIHRAARGRPHIYRSLPRIWFHRSRTHCSELASRPLNPRPSRFTRDPSPLITSPSLHPTSPRSPRRPQSPAQRT